MARMTAKEIDALEYAILKAEKEAMKHADDDDRGSCNFDTPMICINATPKQVAGLEWQLEKVGKKKGVNGTWYFVYTHLEGQANRRTKMAEAVVKSLKEQGYISAVYYQLD